jgi:hypothetical protein
MILELFGLPGAGKTTLLQHLRVLTPQLTWSKPNIPSGLGTYRCALQLSVQLLLEDPQTLVGLLAQRHGRLLLAKLGYRIAITRQFEKSGPNIPVDSGVTQPLLTYAAEYSISPVSSHRLVRLVGLLPLPSLLLYVRVSPERAFERYLERQNLEGVRRDTKVSLEKYRAASAFAESLVAKLPSDRVVTINNDTYPSEECLTDLGKRISKISIYN